MAEVVLFHHAQGLTPGVLAFAEDLRRAGHVVHTPDLYEGRTFDRLEEGIAYAGQIGFSEIVDRGERAAEPLPRAVVYAGFSLGVLPAQELPCILLRKVSAHVRHFPSCWRISASS